MKVPPRVMTTGLLDSGPDSIFRSRGQDYPREHNAGALRARGRKKKRCASHGEATCAVREGVGDPETAERRLRGSRMQIVAHWRMISPAGTTVIAFGVSSTEEEANGDPARGGS
jgi:hypothetical protein